MKLSYAIAQYIADWLNEEKQRRQSSGWITADDILTALEAWKGGAR